MPSTFRQGVLIVSLLLAAAPAWCQSLDPLRPERLRCEYLLNPLGLDEPAPRLSWILAGGGRGATQSAFRVLAASSTDRLANDDGDLWDSGQVAGSSTTHVIYAGKPLTARRACWWKVMSWDREGRPGPWSTPASFEMGLLTPDDWSATWIEHAPPSPSLTITSATYFTPDGKASRDVTPRVADLVREKGPTFRVTNDAMGGDPLHGTPKRLRVEFTLDGVARSLDVAENASVTLTPEPLPLFRRTFTVSGDVRRARVYATALGVYELTLDGRRVGDQHLAPGWTDYAKRVQFQTYDVTAALTPGENVIGAWVGPGWFCGHAGLFGAVRYWGERPALLAQLEIEYADGSTQRVVTDASWRATAGPLVQADLLKGEIFDARRAMPGWNTPGFDDAAWTPATPRSESRTLVADVAEPVRAVAELPSLTLTEPAPGRWTFDLGQNMVGVVRLRVRAPRGTVVTLRHAEILNPDGTIYTQNLRAADSTDRYICTGTGVEEWTPRFTFHGFRYVEITGLTERPALDSVTGVVLASDTPIVGEFECSDPRLNKLWSNIRWGLRGNHLSIPTDCPQRDERMGWMGDAQVFLPTAVVHADVAAFYTKWLADVRDAQRADGAFCDTSPAMKGLSYGVPAWADAGVIVPWSIYEAYGDRRILERSADSMVRWVEWCRAHSTNFIRDKDRGNDYGDWLSIHADTPKDLIGTAYFAHSARRTAETLRTLGRKDEAAACMETFLAVRRAFIERYVDADGRLAGGTQTAYVLALAFNLVPVPLREKALAHLVADIDAKDGKLSTGFVGVSMLLPVLDEGGRPDVAMRLLLSEEFPSWLFSVKHGATTIWERWDGWKPDTGPHPDWGMNSFNHYALGSCGRWMMDRVAGIAPAGYGYSIVRIRPHVGDGLTWARGSYDSIRGRIESAWRLEHGVLTMRVTIPANVTARVFVPCDKTEDVRESGVPAVEAPGVKLVQHAHGEAEFEVGAGSYVFTTPFTPSR
ncbi:MAG: hypothetical protein HBSAPP03_06230 [Phycisphaerae bacterium]|nr:MAG: hypothetical protein HBSAPP03_06230 [Phycisphaerae bacterium]